MTQPWTPNSSYPAPQPYTPPPVKKKHRKWPWILAAGVVVLVIIAAATSGKSSTNSPTVAVPAAPAGPGTQVRDGKLGFVVTSVQAGLSSVGSDDGASKTAQGQYIVVHMTVTNISDKEQDFLGSNQKLVDSTGRQFGDDAEAEAYAQPTGQDTAMWSNINPGNHVDTELVFDVPPGTRPAGIILHDSMFSNGVRVNLN